MSSDARATGPAGASLNDIAYTRLRGDIVRCRLRPGQEVSEGLLADLYELSKAPVRNALARLSQERLLTSIPRRGYIVAPMTTQDVRDVLQLRKVLEPLAAQLAAGKVDADRLVEIEGELAKGFNARRPTSLDRFLTATREFHVAIAESSGNRRLAQAVADLMDDVERVVRMMLADTGFRRLLSESASGHRALTEALLRSDPVEARRQALLHVELSERLLIGTIVAHPTIFGRP